jgi:asparagine synthase (glutamine-hydrolysing)
MGVRETRDALMSAASRTGARVLLTGDIADACVCGSLLAFDSLLRRGRLRLFWRYFQAYRGECREPLHRILAFACLGPFLPLPMHRWVRAVYIRRTSDRIRRSGLPSWILPPLRESLGRRHVQLCLEAERTRRFSNLQREVEYRRLYPPDVARHPVPWSLEIWRPFADRRLHEFLLSVPPEQKYAPDLDSGEFYAGTKQLVRRGLRGILPESIRARTSKTRFDCVRTKELEYHWPLYERAFGPSARPRIAERGYVDPSLFWARLQELKQGIGGSDQSYVAHMVELETWLRSFDRPEWQRATVPAWRNEGSLLLGG